MTAKCHWCDEKPVKAVAVSKTFPLPTPFQGKVTDQRAVVIRACAAHQGRLVTLDVEAKP